MPSNNTTNLSQYDENRLLGVYRAIVEDTQDPMKLARVRIRIPMIHGVSGSDNYLSTKDLPWATPITPTGAGYDHGSCLVPEVGDLVFVMFEDNDRNYPLYLGGCYGKGGSAKQYGSENDSSTYAGGTWTMPNGLSEMPNEVYNASGSPTGKVIYKSPKGATIVIEEADGKESIRILDVLGQSIRLAGSLTQAANKNNGGRRMNADSYSGTGGRSDRLSSDSYSEIAITDAKGQQIRMLGSDIGSSITIRSGENGSGARIDLDHDGAKVEYEGNQIHLLEETAIIEVGGNNIQLHTDGSVEIEGTGKITIAADGKISIEGNNTLSLKSDTVDIQSSTCIIRGNLINYSN